MKKVIFLLLSLILISCNKPSEIEVKNNSSYDVKFSQVYNDNVTYTVEKNKKIYIPALNSAFPDINIKNNKPVSVNYNYEFMIELKDLPSYEILVNNTTSSNITFSITNSPSTEPITIIAGDQQSFIIYTNKPIIETSYKLYYLNDLELIFY